MPEYAYYRPATAGTRVGVRGIITADDFSRAIEILDRLGENERVWSALRHYRNGVNAKGVDNHLAAFESFWKALEVLAENEPSRKAEEGESQIELNIVALCERLNLSYDREHVAGLRRIRNRIAHGSEIDTSKIAQNLPSMQRFSRDLMKELIQRMPRFRLLK